MKVSPVEQDTVDCEYLAYFVPKKFKRIKNIIKEISCNFLVWMLRIFFEQKTYQVTYIKCLC